jgi:hypothetical protein
MLPEIIVSRGREYRLCTGFYLQRIPADEDPSRPFVVLDDIKKLHQTMGLTTPSVAGHACPTCGACICRDVRAKSPSQWWIERASHGDAAPRLNTPPGFRWVFRAAGHARTDDASDSLLPVYAAPDGFYAVDLRSIVSYVRAGPGKVRVEHLRLDSDARRLDITDIQREREAHDRRSFDLHWIPAYSPAAGTPAVNWHLDTIGAPPTAGAPRMSPQDWRGAMIDADLYERNPDFADVSGRYVEGVRYSNYGVGGPFVPPSQYDPNRFHATRVAGVMVARPGGPDGPGYPSDYEAIGVASGGKIICHDVIDWNLAAIQAALQAVIDNHLVKVLNMSFAYYEDPLSGQPQIPEYEAEILDAMLYEAHERGVVLCAAAGNAATDSLDFTSGSPYQIGWPAQNPHVIAVGAIDDEDRRITSSQWDSRSQPLARRGFRKGVSVVAPGVAIVTPNAAAEIVETFCGTSAAAPQVAALAMLLLDRYDHLNNRQIRFVIEATARKCAGGKFTWRPGFGASTYDDDVGHGCIDVAAALALADVSCTVRLDGQTAVIDVTNDGPADAQDIRLYIWELDILPRAWTLRRVADPLGYELTARSYPPETATPISLGALAAGESRPHTVATSARQLLVVADDAADEAFHRAHIDGKIHAMNPSPYNNIAWIGGPPPTRPLAR